MSGSGGVDREVNSPARAEGGAFQLQTTRNRSSKLQKHHFFSIGPEFPDDRRRFYLGYLPELSDDDLKMFDSDAISIGDENFKSKLANIAGRKQIRRSKPNIN